MKKTNLDIVDQDSWNWIKNQKNEYDLRSVADFIFKVINEYRTMDIEKWLFLINIEKYFEYNYFDMNELSDIMNLRTEKIVMLIKKYIGSDIEIFEMKDKELKNKAIKKIHNLMIENRILPRELSIAYNLKTLVDKEHLDLSKYENFTDEGLDEEDEDSDQNIEIGINNDKILTILFPDIEERRKEIYCETIRYVEFFIKSYTEINFDCQTCKKDCIIKRPDFIYYKLGIDVSLDDLNDDLASEILKEKFKTGFITCYGLCLVIAVDSMIKRNLLTVKYFIKNELYLFEDPKAIMIIINILIQNSKIQAKSILKDKEGSEENIFDIYKKLSTYK